MSLYASTLELLHADTRSIPQIARESGLNKHWLESFKKEVCKNPGVNTVEQLHAFLTGQDWQAKSTKVLSKAAPSKRKKRARVK